MRNQNTLTEAEEPTLIVMSLSTATTPLFTGNERMAIVTAAVVAVLLAAGNLGRTLRPANRPVRYAPFGLVILSLAFAFVSLTVVFAESFLLRHPELVVATAVGGGLACSAACFLDPKPKAKPGNVQPAVVWRPGKTPYPMSFIRYYTSSSWVEIDSRYDAAESLFRVMELNTRGRIRLWTDRDGQLCAVGAQWTRSNVPPVFRGRFEERAGQVVLRGEIGVERSIRLTLGFFCVIIFVLAPGKGLLVLAGMIALLFAFYRIGKHDPDKMVNTLNEVLNPITALP